MNLWGVSVTEKTESQVDVPEDRDLLITRIALGPNAPKGVPNVVSLVNHDYDDETYVLGTLRGEACEQFELDVNICSDSSVTLKVQGPGTIHFVGYYNRLASFEEDYSDLSDEEDYSDEEDGALNERVKAYMGGDSSSGEDYDDDAGNVESYDSDSDLDMDEETENASKSPVKNKQSQPIQAKPVPPKAAPQAPKQAVPPTQAKPQPVQKQKQQPPQQQKSQPQADGENKKKKKKKNKNKNNANAVNTNANSVPQEKKRKEGGEHSPISNSNKKPKTG